MGGQVNGSRGQSSSVEDWTGRSCACCHEGTYAVDLADPAVRCVWYGGVRGAGACGLRLAQQGGDLRSICCEMGRRFGDKV